MASKEFDTTETQAMGYAHVMSLPPHGPFAYLSAGTLAERFRVLGEHQAELERRAAATGAAAPAPVAAPPPATCLRWMQGQWELSHMRHWPQFYAPAELTSIDVESL